MGIFNVLAVFDWRNMVLVDASRSLVNNGFVQILLEASRYHLYLIFFSNSLYEDCIWPVFSTGSSISKLRIFFHLEYIYPRYIYSRWRKIRGFDKDDPVENTGQMKSSFKDFEKKIKWRCYLLPSSRIWTTPLLTSDLEESTNTIFRP